MSEVIIENHKAIGKKFRMLTALQAKRVFPENKKAYLRLFCICDCGTKKWVRHGDLISKTKDGCWKVISCGCHKTKNTIDRCTTHGRGARNKRRTSEYRSWSAMKGRCLNNKNQDYFLYGGRGINVCEKWMSFEGFYEDMGEKPEPKSRYSIDRIDNDKGYFKENCRWATQKQQVNNSKTVLAGRVCKVCPICNENFYSPKNVGKKYCSSKCYFKVIGKK